MLDQILEVSMVHLTGMFFAALLIFIQLLPAVAMARFDAFTEPVRVSQKLLYRRSAGSPTVNVSEVLSALYPKVVPVYDDSPGQGSLVQDVQMLSGPFILLDSGGVRPISNTIAALVLEEESFDDGGNKTEIIPKLAVLRREHGRLEPIAAMELVDFALTIEPEHDGGSGLKLGSWAVHPSAKAIVVTVLRSQTDQDRNNATAELCVYFVGKNQLLEVYQSDVLDQTDETTDDMTYSEQMRIDTSVDKSSLFNGLRKLNVKNYSSRTENGRLRHVEIDYLQMCWNGESFSEECDESLDVTAPARRRSHVIAVPNKIPLHLDSKSTRKQ